MIPDGFLWNQAVLERNHPINNGLLNIVLLKEGRIYPVGTAFIIAANGETALAMSAAHCFEGIAEALSVPKHNQTALPEFLPPQEDIELENVKAIYMRNDKIIVCPVKVAVWDKISDLAVLQVFAPENKSDLFDYNFRLDNAVPIKGDLVAMIAFGNTVPRPDIESKVQLNEDEKSLGVYQRQLMMRLGRVEEVFPEGTHMIRTPCVQTTIPIYDAMSGGIVARWGNVGEPIQPFALICHAQDPQPVNDRSKSGESIGAIINMEIEPQSDQRQVIKMILKSIRKARLTE